MKRMITCLSALVAAGFLVSSAHAGHLGGGAAPEFNSGSDDGTIAADSHLGHWYVHPFSRGIFPPLAGLHHVHKHATAPVAAPGGAAASTDLVFPTHNYARSPRDFYMVDP